MAAIKQFRCVDTLSAWPTPAFAQPTQSNRHTFPAQRSLRDGTEADAEERGFKEWTSKAAKMFGLGTSNYGSLSRTFTEDEAILKRLKLHKSTNWLRSKKLFKYRDEMIEKYGNDEAYVVMADVLSTWRGETTFLLDLAAGNAEPIAKRLGTAMGTVWLNRNKEEGEILRLLLSLTTPDEPIFTGKNLLDHPLFSMWIDFVTLKTKDTNNFDEVLAKVFMSTLNDEHISNTLEAARKERNSQVAFGLEIASLERRKGALTLAQSFEYLNLNYRSLEFQLHNKKFQYWVDYVGDEEAVKFLVNLPKDFATASPNTRKEIDTAKRLESARRDTHAAALAERLQNAQMKAWTEGEDFATVAQVFDKLSNGEGFISYGEVLPTFDVLVRFAKYVNNDEKVAMKALVQAFVSEKGEYGSIITLLTKLSNMKEPNPNESALMEAVTNSWKDDAMDPKVALSMLPINPKDPKLLNTSTFKMWSDYMKQNFHDSENQMTAILFEKFDPYEFALIVGNAKHLDVKDEVLVNALQKYQENWVQNNCPTVEDAFNYLKVDQGGRGTVFPLSEKTATSSSLEKPPSDSLITTPVFRMWFTYMNNLHGDKADEQMVLFLSKLYDTDMRGFLRMLETKSWPNLVITKDAAITKDIATKLQNAHLRIYKEQQETPISAMMNLLHLNTNMHQILKYDHVDNRIMIKLVKHLQDPDNKKGMTDGAAIAIAYADIFPTASLEKILRIEKAVSTSSNRDEKDRYQYISDALNKIWVILNEKKTKLAFGR
ncbi:unnamed protein product [Peronospora belbahrii]|uniref:Uncharacterized protein n=1 Tax=Peronospora belbahrii TaxID=622444 RepID=A0ABN8CL78_9STRA|nr:unnamed protein product [Peronospora belbahrii]